MNKDRRNLNEIKRQFVGLPTTELVAIIERQDREQWAEEDLAAASELLDDRRRGVAVDPTFIADTNADFSIVLSSVTVLRACAFIYLAISFVASAVILTRHETIDINVVCLIALTIFQGIAVCALLFVIALIGQKATSIASISDNDQ